MRPTFDRIPMNIQPFLAKSMQFYNSALWTKLRKESESPDAMPTVESMLRRCYIRHRCGLLRFRDVYHFVLDDLREKRLAAAVNLGDKTRPFPFQCPPSPYMHTPLILSFLFAALSKMALAESLVLFTAFVSTSFSGCTFAIHNEDSQMVYMIYKQYEPNGIISTLVLLVFVPSVLAYMLHAQFVDILSATVSVFTGFWTSVLAFVVTYRLSPWHPLARFPGPLNCRLSKFWMAYVTAQGRAPFYIRELHAAYGDVVRIGGSFICFR